MYDFPIIRLARETRQDALILLVSGCYAALAFKYCIHSVVVLWLSWFVPPVYMYQYDSLIFTYAIHTWYIYI